VTAPESTAAEIPTGSSRRVAALLARQARRAAANRARVHRALDAARMSGRPVSFTELLAETGLSRKTVCRHTRAYLREVVTELLGREVRDEESFRIWMALYGPFASRIKFMPEARALQAQSLRLCIESLDRAGQPITYSAVEAMTVAALDRIRAAIRTWEAETGRRAARAISWQQVTFDMVLPLVDPALHRMPLTFLDDPRAYRPAVISTLRTIAGLAPPKLRNTAFLCLVADEADFRNDDRFFRALAEYLPVLSMADIDEIEPDAFYPAFHDGRVLPEVATSIRTRWLQAYFRLLRKQEAYFERLTPEQAQCLVPFRLRPVTSAFFWRRSLLCRQVSDEQRGRRKAATAAVHYKFYLFRNIAERRLNQLVRLRQAFRDSCDQARGDPGVSFPAAFAYTEEAVTPAGSARTVTHRFRLWDHHALRRAHASVIDQEYYRARAARGYELSADTLFLSYEGASAERETAEQAGFWFADLVRAGALTYDGVPLSPAAQGYSKAGSLFPPARPDWSVSTSRWLRRVAADLGLLFLPVDTLLATGLIGHANLQIMTKTGARVGEVLQIRLTREHLTRAELPGGKEAIAFRAIPKGREAEEPFYIDGSCLKALHAWFAFLREHEGGAAVVPPSHVLRMKCKPAPYLFQFGGRHFDTSDVNACMRILLHGVEVSTARGETVLLSAHLLRHGFATEMRELEVPLDVIALLLKQRDVEVTRYYSQPTPAQLVEVQERIFVDRLDLTRTHLRAPAEIRRQLEDARGGVGALVPVVGGTCTVANMCPAKFACVGCAGNAPDPAKRTQVEDFKRIYEDMVRLASEQGLPAEERKARAVVAGCEDMLAEMALIEATERDGAQTAELHYAAAARPGERGERR